MLHLSETICFTYESYTEWIGKHKRRARAYALAEKKEVRHMAVWGDAFYQESLLNLIAQRLKVRRIPPDSHKLIFSGCQGTRKKVCPYSLFSGPALTGWKGVPSSRTFLRCYCTAETYPSR